MLIVRTFEFFEDPANLTQILATDSRATGEV
jgi:hypothetical protein